MIVLFIFLVVLFPDISYGQMDEIILPELELVIEDQSALNTISSGNAVLRERNPEFQDIFFEELSVVLPNSLVNQDISPQNYKPIYSLQASYGSFNFFDVNLNLQNVITNVFYQITYQGQFRENAQWLGQIFDNTSYIQNFLSVYMDLNLDNTFFSFQVLHDYRERNFFDNELNNQDTHLIPMNINVKHWIDDFSFITSSLSTMLGIIQLQDTSNRTTREAIVVDNILDLLYETNPKENIYIQANTSYILNYLSKDIAHTAKFSLNSGFRLPKGFLLNIGIAWINSTEKTFFIWPEIGLTYAFNEIFSWNFHISGDFTLNNAQLLTQENQLFSLDFSPEYRWIYGTTLKVTPVSYFWLGIDINYNDYKQKRIYQYNSTTKLYTFEMSTTDILETGVSLGVDIPKFFNAKLAYVYQHIPENWLLYSPHKIDMVMNLGYHPAGFNIETQLTWYANRLLTLDLKTGQNILLNIKISQKIRQVAELYIEVKNIINQNIQFTQGTYYGGIQANGGFIINF